MSLQDTYQSRKNLLASNLTSMGVTASGTEGLTTLANKISNIPLIKYGVFSCPLTTTLYNVFYEIPSIITNYEINGTFNSTNATRFSLVIKDSIANQDGNNQIRIGVHDQKDALKFENGTVSILTRSGGTYTSNTDIEFKLRHENGTFSFYTDGVFLGTLTHSNYSDLKYVCMLSYGATKTVTITNLKISRL